MQGFKRPLQWEDMFALPHSVECANVYPEYALGWKKELADGERTAKVRHAPFTRVCEALDLLRA